MDDRSSQVVIAGAGQAGLQVALSLRQEGFAGAITLVGDEGRVPYQRPPLSKAYLKEDFGFERLELRPEAILAENGIALRLGDPAVAIRRADGRLDLASGASLAYDRLVLALGARNRVLPLDGLDAPHVHALRTAADAERLRDALGSARRLAVIGGGFIGLEVAASARGRGLEVTVVEAAERLMGRVVSPAVSAFFLEAHRAMGTDVRLGEALTAVTPQGVRTTAGEVAADLVLVAAGVVPNDALAMAAGLATERGIRVDASMRTSDPAILAVGDCAVFESRHAEGLLRLESVQNAVDQAKCAALTILGRPKAYDSVPWFWSDQGSFKLQIAGIASGADHVHVAGSVAEGRLVAYAFREERLVAVETVNRPGDHMAGRRLLSEEFRVTRAEVAEPDFDLRRHLAAGAALGR